MTEPNERPSADTPPGHERPEPEPAGPRPWLERIGMAAIAALLGALLIVVAVAAFAGGELILAAMSLSGAVLTIGIGLATLIRG
jgi:uncharacterized membrane protein YkgB